MQPQENNLNVLRTIIVAILFIFIAILTYILITSQKQQIPTPETQDINTSISAPTLSWDKYAQYDTFNDGLKNPARTKFSEPDEYGVGTTSILVFERDLNNDGRPDRITRTHIENGTSHFTNEYKIELATNNGFTDITPPDGLETQESADCAIQKLRFSFKPVFEIEKIGRQIQDDYLTPTLAYRTIYQIKDNELTVIDYAPMDVVCDVADLFRKPSLRIE